MIKNRNPHNNKIDFFCIGAAKSGTTALHYFLRQHPEIYMPLKKEIHHFADDLLKKNDYWLQNNPFFKLFQKTKKNQIAGETSVFYLLSENAAKNIFEYNPNAKIIIMLRNSVDVAYSLYSQLVFNGEENITNFKDAIEIESDRRKGINLPPNTRIYKKHLYVEVVKYTEQIKRFQKYFSKEQIHFIFFKDFKKNTLNSVQNTYQFLNINNTFVPKLKIHNSNKKIKNRKLQKITTFVINSFFSRFLCEDNLEKLRNFAISINSIQQKRIPLDFDTKQLLINTLKQEIINLEKLLNIDLSTWKK